jgi:hypothetical protein
LPSGASILGTPGDTTLIGAGFTELDAGLETWTSTRLLNAPERRWAHTAVWTGTTMIVWGGRDLTNVGLNTGGRYDPVTDTWTPVSTGNAPSGRWFHTAVWTGSKMVVWGGSSQGIEKNTGGQYDPASDSWTPTPPAALQRPHRHTAVWTGARMIVWGGEA